MSFLGTNNTFPGGTAAREGLMSCHRCHQLEPVGVERCGRCSSKLHLRTPNSVATSLALVLTSLLFYIPANVLPIMTTSLLGNETKSTILGGVILFLEHGSYFIALVIFTASVLIPLAKMMSITFLCLAASSNKKLNQQEMTRLYRLTEFIGKWSMIDVFVVAVLVALVRVGNLMAINPGMATSAFAVVVILTMIAAHQFDVRLIWDKLEQE